MQSRPTLNGKTNVETWKSNSHSTVVPYLISWMLINFQAAAAISEAVALAVAVVVTTAGRGRVLIN